MVSFATRDAYATPRKLVFRISRPSCQFPDSFASRRDEPMHSATDLRVVKTHNAIRRALDQMICEVPYGQITVKELCARALINRKTFYSHYCDLDALFDELAADIVAPFVERTVPYRSIKDVENIVRVFFNTIEAGPPSWQRIVCDESYHPVFRRCNHAIMDLRRAQNTGALGIPHPAEEIVFAFFGSVTPIVYRQWVEDGRALALDDAIELAVGLICHGMAHLDEHRGTSHA